MEALALRPVDPTGHGDIAFADLRFPTPSGKIEFASARGRAAVGRRSRCPITCRSAKGTSRRHAATYPLQLLSCKTRDRIHSQFGNLDWVRDVERPHRLDMHPTDAAARGLADGDEADVWNDRGRITLRVRIDHGLRPGVVHVLEGRCHDGDPDVNVLTDAGVTDINHGATFYECLVEVAGTRRPATCDRRPAARQSTRPTVESNAESRPLDLARGALSDVAGRKPPAAGRKPQAGFVLDLGRCVGCAACVLACRLENGWSSDNPWRRVLPLNLSRRAAGPTYFLSVACHHCERPACVAACPSGAYEKRADGVVVHHESRCIGCRYCEMACPFGAPRFDVVKGVMTKCHLCHHRLDAGEAPACVAACPTEALREPAPGSRRPTSGGVGDPGLGPTGAIAGEPDVPGFVDVAGCSPNIRFVAPRGQRRATLYDALCRNLRGPR